METKTAKEIAKVLGIKAPKNTDNTYEFVGQCLLEIAKRLPKKEQEVPVDENVITRYEMEIAKSQIKRIDRIFNTTHGRKFMSWENAITSQCLFNRRENASKN